MQVQDSPQTPSRPQGPLKAALKPTKRRLTSSGSVDHTVEDSSESARTPEPQGDGKTHSMMNTFLFSIFSKTETTLPDTDTPFASARNNETKRKGINAKSPPPQSPFYLPAA